MNKITKSKCCKAEATINGHCKLCDARLSTEHVYYEEVESAEIAKGTVRYSWHRNYQAWFIEVLDDANMAHAHDFVYTGEADAKARANRLAEIHKEPNLDFVVQKGAPINWGRGYMQDAKN